MIEGLMPDRTVDLIKTLDEGYPHECLRPGETLESAHRRAGARELIDELKAWWDETIEVEIQESLLRAEDQGRD